jgi:hypothetical protein
MIPTKYYLLYAKMHTRKYTTATYKPSDPTEEVRRKVQKAGAGIACYVSSHGEVGMTSIHEGELSTKYGVDIVLTIENPETNEIRTLTVPREKVTVYRNLIVTDAPYVFVGIDKETNEPNYEIHVGSMIQDDVINLLHPTEED